ncbi:MAG: hypothetical protein V1839_00305 [archaeon]
MKIKLLKDDSAYFRKIRDNNGKEISMNYSRDMGIVCLNLPEGRQYMRRADGVIVDEASTEIPGKKPVDYGYLDDIVAKYLDAERSWKNDNLYFRKILDKNGKEISMNYSPHMGIICLNLPEGQRYIRKADGTIVDAAGAELPGEMQYKSNYLDDIVAKYLAAKAEEN